MHSPTKNPFPKKTRKNTFSQTAITQNEVGDFHGGYFVMPDASASKENDHPPRSKITHKVERSPARRKQHANDPLPSSPVKERTKTELQISKPPQQSPPVDINLMDCLKAELLLTPSSFSLPPNKSNPQVSPKQYFDPYGIQLHKNPLSSPGKDMLSTSPPPSGRWAGPAFGNAPHPSALPLPEWTNFSVPSSPPAHDGGSGLQGMVYPANPSAYPLSPSVARSDIPLSSIPVVPFPYVDSASPALLSTSPSLTQLSTDLRRMLNINGGPIFNSDPILVSANSS
jgi:hypothetical protein